MPDRTVFITGCSTGIGRAAALLFAEHGYRVIATARRVDALRDLENISRRATQSLCVTTCDVASEESMQRAIAFAHKTFGPIHILVNNAGYGQMGALELVPLADARRQFEINTLGALRLMQLLVPDMRAASWGRIINVSSIVGRVASPFGGVYSASKFALEALSDTMRLELAPFGIHTVSILPGPVKSEFMHNTLLPEMPPDSPAFYRVLRQHFLKRRAGARPFEISAERVAQVIVQAAEVRWPRPRYYLTISARVSAFGKRFVTDRFMDRCVRAFYGLGSIKREARKR